MFFSPWQLDSGVFIRMASEDKLRGFAGRLLILDLPQDAFRSRESNLTFVAI